MAFGLSDEAGRTQLLHQFNPAIAPAWYLLAIGVPLFVAAIGHIAGILRLVDAYLKLGSPEPVIERGACGGSYII